MKKFRIVIIGVCPSDWNIEKVKSHLRKSFTQREVEGAVIEEVPLLVERSEPEVKTQSD